VWKHNTHIGYARWTDMAEVGMVNVGQFVRKAHPADDVVLIGFGSHRGSVIASNRWGGATRSMPLPPAEPSSIEALLHEELDELRSSLLIFGHDARNGRPPSGLTEQSAWSTTPAWSISGTTPSRCSHPDTTHSSGSIRAAP
jgi:erythromycin esterase-like protein